MEFGARVPKNHRFFEESSLELFLYEKERKKNSHKSELKEIQNSGIKKKTFSDGPNLIDYQIGILLNVNLRNINKISNIDKKIFPNKDKFYFLYVHENIKSDIIKHFDNLNKPYKIVCYNDKLVIYKNIDELIQLFDVSTQLNSDYLFIIKDLNITNIINNINNTNFDNDKYKIIKL